MSSLTEIEQAWETAYRYGTREERIARAKRWLPYYTLFCAQAAERPFDPDADPVGFVSVLVENGILRPDDTLLDIGAGMGDYALRLAKKCRSVTALEVNPAGIAVMQKRAADAHIDNLEPVCALWEQFETDRIFDITFTSMCPAICNVDELRRMERMTRRACCILTVLPGSYDLHRRAMLRELNLHPAGMLTDGDRYQTILTAMGRNVRVFTKAFTSRHDLALDAALRQYTVYFGIFGMDERDAEAYVRDYFARHAENGVLRDESRMRYALLTWNVN